MGHGGCYSHLELTWNPIYSMYTLEIHGQVMKNPLQLRGKGWGNVPAAEVGLWNILSCSPGGCWNYTGHGESQTRTGPGQVMGDGGSSGPAEGSK